ncbi:MAG: hypothetical protein JO023_14210 [Chloroflexi bacterium]|nr:hypothetical protein [Chloroflexota bacterium]
MSGHVLGCLLDEDLDPALAELLDAAGLGWRVTSVHAEHWLGLKNGPLLGAMAERGLRVLVTGDRALHGQRRRELQRLRIGVVLVRNPARAAERVEAIARSIVRVGDGGFAEVDE